MHSSMHYEVECQSSSIHLHSTTVSTATYTMIRRSALALSRRVAGSAASRPTSTRMFTPSIARCKSFPFQPRRHRYGTAGPRSPTRLRLRERNFCSERESGAPSFRSQWLTTTLTSDAAHDGGGDPKPGQPSSKMVPFEGTICTIKAD